MKHLFFVSLFVAGCATTAASPNDRSVSNAGASSPDIAQTSGSSGVPCAQEVALECGGGGVDGCLKNLTTVHVCVSSTAQAGPSCDQEVALQCPSGEVDACSLAPAPSAQHVCVRQ